MADCKKSTENATIDAELSQYLAMQSQKPRVIVIGGLPGSGKSTLCRDLVKMSHFHFVHLSTGDCCREAVAQKTAFGKLIEPFMTRGDYVPDDLMMQLVLNRFQSLQKEEILLLDGFPRTAQQAYELEKVANVRSYIYLLDSADTCKQRILKRLIDVETGESIIEISETYQQDRPLSRRELDDDEDSINRRMQVHQDHIGTILVYYARKLQVVNLQGAKPPMSRSQLKMKVCKLLCNMQPTSSSFCQCKLRLVDHINLPCGHWTWCSECALTIHPPGGNAKSSCCPACEEKITSYIVARRQTPFSAEEDKTSDFQLSSELIENEDGHVNRATFGVTIDVRESYARSGPNHFIFVIDVSESMDDPATFKTERNQVVGIGYSLLESVKRALKTLVACMADTDQFTLVSFNKFAKREITCSDMKSENRILAMKAVNDLKAQGETNIKAGIMHALDQIKANTTRNHVFVLTDGKPMYDKDFDGKQLREWKISHPDTVFQLHTFAFGSEPTKGLLLSLAEGGGGTFLFLPNASVTGAAFVLAVANASNVCTQDAKLVVIAERGATLPKLQNPKGVNEHSLLQQSPKRIVIDLGALYYGQPRHFPIDVDLPEGFRTAAGYLTVTLITDHYNILQHRANNLISTSVGRQISSEAQTLQTLSDILKTNTSKDVCCYDCTSLNLLIATLKTIYDDYPDASLLVLIKDLQGESAKKPSKLFKAQQFKKNDKGQEINRLDEWGHHYIAGYKRALEFRLCTYLHDAYIQSFMSPVVQAFEAFGQTMYEKVAIQNTPPTPAPMPKPTTPVVVHVSSLPSLSPPSYSSVIRSAPPRGYTASSTSGGTCFSGRCLVNVQAKSTNQIVSKPMSELCVGDYVLVSSSRLIRVGAILVTCLPNVVYQFNNGLEVTAKHPLRKESGEWFRPRDCRDVVTKRYVHRVFNVILESANGDIEDHILLVNGMECLTLGHESRNTAIRHDFYGSKQRLEQAIEHLETSGTGSKLIHGHFLNGNNHVRGFF